MTKPEEWKYDPSISIKMFLSQFYRIHTIYKSGNEDIIYATCWDGDSLELYRPKDHNFKVKTLIFVARKLSKHEYRRPTAFEIFKYRRLK